jgi:acetyl esterase/lipase
MPLAYACQVSPTSIFEQRPNWEAVLPERRRIFGLPGARYNLTFARVNPGPEVLARWRRRKPVVFLAVTIFAGAWTATAQPAPVTTYTFKTFHSQTNVLQADVHRRPGDAVRPVIVFIHGGALMMGGRGMSTRPVSLLAALLDAGYVVVSIEYRLAPRVKLPAILEDVRDACDWVRKRGPELFRIDPDEIFVMGQSAGGYLTLMTGCRVQPRPRALVSFWGYGDIAGPWYSQPDSFYRQQPLVAKDEAEKSGGGKLYLYCRQQGLWPKVLTGWDPDIEPRAFDPFCPERNVTRDFPPTLLIHGTKDTDVPYELSVRMARELAAREVEHQFITITNGGHGFDQRQTEIATRTYQQVVEFLHQHQKR